MTAWPSHVVADPAGNRAALQLQRQLEQQLQEAREQLRAEAARSASLQQQLQKAPRPDAHSNGDASELRSLNQQVWQLRAQLDAAQQVRAACSFWRVQAVPAAMLCRCTAQALL